MATPFNTSKRPRRNIAIPDYTIPPLLDSDDEGFQVVQRARPRKPLVAKPNPPASQPTPSSNRFEPLADLLDETPDEQP